MRLNDGGGLVRCVRQVGNRAKGLFAVVRRCGVQQHIAARHARFHLNDFFALHVQLGGHHINFVVRQRVTVGGGISSTGVCLEALLHRAQVEEQLALGFGGSHLDHAPVFQDVLVDLSLDPVHGVAHQPYALVGVKALDGLHQAHVALLD